jgi:pyruvate formate lyase activating enzyme
MKEALLWNNDDGGSVNCNLCSHRCRIVPGKHGRCAVRVNDNGVLRTRVYGRVIADHVDPIEKKPLYHFLPASETFSIAAVGCNFRCGFCQNHGISQAAEFVDTDNGVNGNINNNVGQGDDLYGGTAMSPQSIVDTALRYGCPSVSFTYTEPTVFFEYALDTAKAAKAAGLRTVFVSNGFMTGECLREVAPYLDACNIDLKSFRDEFYKKQCGASLKPVLDSLKAIKGAGIWLEVTTLVIGGLNDSDAELAALAGFIVSELGMDTPWHVSGFYPRYRMADMPATAAESIEKACEIGAGTGLRHVYGGNVNICRDTRCPKCGAVLISRRGYKTNVSGMSADGGCGACGERVSGIFC